MGMAAAAGPMIAGMMSGHPPKPGYPSQPLGHSGQQRFVYYSILKLKIKKVN